MKRNIHLFRQSVFGLSWIAFTIFSFLSVTTQAQQLRVLPTDGSISQDNNPQGGARFQRQFYLITPEEMAGTELPVASMINAIGFTLGVAQGDTTTGDFKVYIQNTTDTESRRDTAWTTVNATTNFLDFTNLILGDYEWQVKAVCPLGSSGFSDTESFSLADPDDCPQPDNLSTTDISTTAATFNWNTGYASTFTEYEVEYSIANSGVWITNTTTDTFFTATSLMVDTIYQWRVRTTCSIGTTSYTSTSFSTLAADVCSEPTGLTNGTAAAITMPLSWTAASGAIRYEVQYRRLGNSVWVSSFAFSPSTTITGLSSGTTYEWRIRTVCSAGVGSYVYGTNFVTTGTSVCYTPVGLDAKVFSDTSAHLSWSASSGATSYVIRYRLKNAISWANAIAPMTLVHSDPITIPNTIGLFSIPFSGMGIGTTNYDGGGLYIAWEYSRATGALPSLNTALATSGSKIIKDVNGLDSIAYVLSFATVNDTTDTAQRSTLTGASLRPETWLGSTGLVDNAEVAAVYALGKHALYFVDPTPISALVKNHSGTSQTYTATLTVKDQDSGAVKYTGTENVTIAAGASELVTFTGWSPSAVGSDSIIVSIPMQSGENVLDNNSNFYLQEVNSSIVGYDDGSKAITSAGFGTGDGLLLARYTMDGCGSVNAAQIYLNYSVIGKEVYAVIMDAAGTLIDSSDVFTPGNSDINDYHAFYFPEIPYFSGSDYYIGLAQPADAMDGYYPVGVQWETADIRSGAYYRADIDGTNLVDQPSPGRLMIQAEVIPGFPYPVINGDLNLCSGATNTLSVGSANTRFASAVLDYSSQYSSNDYSAAKALGTPDVYPNYNTNVGQWLSSSADGQREYLELSFPNPAPINFIDIYEILNPGSIDTVYVKDPGTGNFVSVYTHTAAAESQVATINHISFPLTSYDVSEVRIALNSAAVSGYSGIDAVGIGEETDPASFSSYAWSNGSTTQSIDVTTAGTYSVSVTDGGGCTGSASVEVVTPSEITPTISIGMGETTTFCAGGSVTLTSSIASDITWSNGATTQSITVTTSGSYTVSYDGGSCGPIVSDPTVVTVNPLPSPTINGLLAICSGSNTGLSVSSSYSQYLWSTGATTQSITANTANNYSVSVIDGNGCEGSASVNVVNAPAPTPVVTGDDGFCPGESATIDAGAGYSQYLWSNGATTQSITVSTVGTYTATVTNSFGCSASASKTLIEYTIPAPVIAGTLSFCAGNSSELSAGSGYAAYSWSTGETTPSIFVEDVGTYTVSVTSVNGCMASTSVDVTLNGSVPATPGAITGISSLSCDEVGLVYSIAPVANATRYDWTVPPNATIVSGQGTTTITINTSGGFSGMIVVKAANACGQSPTYGQQFTVVETSLGVPATPYGLTTGLCNGVNTVYYTSAVSGALSYNWTVPSGVTITGGQGSTSITVAVGPTFTAGEICVEAIFSCDETSTCLAVSCNEPDPISTPPGENGSLANNLKSLELSVAPNPNSGIFRLEGDLPAEGDVNVQVYTLLGKPVFNTALGSRAAGHFSEELNISNLPAGTYLVGVKMDKLFWHTKIVLVR